MHFRTIFVLGATFSAACAQSFFDSDDVDLRIRDVETNSEIGNSLLARDVDAILAARGYDFDSEINNFLIARDVEAMLDIEVPSLVRRGNLPSKVSNRPPPKKQTQTGGDRLPTYEESQRQPRPPAYNPSDVARHPGSHPSHLDIVGMNTHRPAWRDNGKSTRF